MNYLFINGIIISMIYSYFILPRKSGYNIKLLNLTLYPLLYNGMIIIPLTEKYGLHIHHWLIYIFIYYYFNNYIIKGFSIGLVIQGLTYSDFNIFLVNNPYIK